MELITNRPENMKFSDYQLVRREQNRQIKDRITYGFIFYKSWEFPNNGFTAEANFRAGNIIKYKPYVKSRSRD